MLLVAVVLLAMFLYSRRQHQSLTLMSCLRTFSLEINYGYNCTYHEVSNNTEVCNMFRTRHRTAPHRTPHHITSHHITSRQTTSNHVKPRQTTSNHIQPHHNTSHHTTYNHIKHIKPHHTTPHHYNKCNSRKHKVNLPSRKIIT